MSRTGSNVERFNVAERLEGLIRQLDSLKSLLRDRMTAEQISDAREAYAGLKEALKAEQKRWSSVSGEQQLNAAEKAFLKPAVNGALCQLRPATNSHPHNAGWNSCLYAARFDLQYYVRQLVQTASGQEPEPAS